MYIIGNLMMKNLTDLNIYFIICFNILLIFVPTLKIKHNGKNYW
jgi:cell division protein FtsW (lipid II flippase)